MYLWLFYQIISQQHGLMLLIQEKMVCGYGFHPENLLPTSIGTMANQANINHRSTVHSHSIQAEQNGMMHFVHLAITLCARNSECSSPVKSAQKSAASSKVKAFTKKSDQLNIEFADFLASEIEPSISCILHSYQFLFHLFTRNSKKEITYKNIIYIKKQKKKLPNCSFFTWQFSLTKRTDTETNINWINKLSG